MPIKPPIPSSNKFKLLIGLFFIIAAFVCIVGIFFVLIDTQRTKLVEIDQLKEQVVLLNTEKGIVDRQVEELKSVQGTSIHLDKLIAEARRVYDAEDQAQKEGRLWVDREASQFVVTLGALNGLQKGSRLTVYDGEKKVGSVEVQTPLDVISYVDPVDRTLKDFTSDYYRVVIEEKDAPGPG